MSAVPRPIQVVQAFVVSLVFFAGVQATPAEEPSPASHDASASAPDGATQPKPQSSDAVAAKSAATKPSKLVLVDDTLTDDQLKQILARGYKPESQASGNEVYYCRREHSLGTRFETKTCKTSQRILQDEAQGKEMTSKAQRPTGNPAQ